MADKPDEHEEEEHEDDGDKSKKDDDKGTGKPAASGSDSGGSGGGSDTEKDSLRQMVREEIRAALGRDNPNGGGRSRTENIEERAERLVREATEKLAAEKEHAEEHKQLREKKEPERPPKKTRLITKVFWGDDDR